MPRYTSWETRRLGNYSLDSILEGSLSVGTIPLLQYELEVQVILYAHLAFSSPTVQNFWVGFGQHTDRTGTTNGRGSYTLVPVSLRRYPTEEDINKCISAVTTWCAFWTFIDTLLQFTRQIPDSSNMMIQILTKRKWNAQIWAGRPTGPCDMVPYFQRR